MQIRFVAPRIHPNYHRTIQVLENAGAQVAFDVSKSSTSEFSKYETFFANCWLSRLLVQRYSDTGDKKRSFPNYLTYYRHIRKYRPDLLIIRNPTRFFSIIAILAGIFSGSKILFYSLSDFKKWKPIKRNFVSLLMRAFKIAWMSPIYHIYDPEIQFKQFYSVPMLPRLSDSPQDAPLKKSGNDPVKILMVGKWRLSRKRHEWLLKAAIDLKSQHEFLLVFVGDCFGEKARNRMANLKDFAARSAILDYVKFEENLSASEMKQRYIDSDLFVLPASNEPAGVSVLEALACSLPVICSSTCGVRGYIRHGSNGYVFQSDDYQDFLGCLKQALIRVRSSTEMSYNAYRAYRSHFDDAVFLRKFRYVLSNTWDVEF